jgi:hypothetical protein
MSANKCREIATSDGQRDSLQIPSSLIQINGALGCGTDIDSISDKALSESILDRLDPLEMKG